MAVISNLDLDGKNVTKYNNATISNINFNGTDYHFAKSSLADNGKCINAVEEPIIDMNIYGENYYQKRKNLYPSYSVDNFSYMVATINDNVFSIDYTNNGSGSVYPGYFTKSDTSLVTPGKTYTYVLEILKWEGTAKMFILGDSWSSNSDERAQLSYKTVNVESGKTYFLTLTGLDLEKYRYLSRDAISVKPGETAKGSWRVSLFEGEMTAEEFARTGYIPPSPTIKVLPTEYQRVECLESTGTQYIDTEIKPSINLTAEVVFSTSIIPPDSTTDGIFGYRYTSTFGAQVFSNNIYLDRGVIAGKGRVYAPFEVNKKYKLISAKTSRTIYNQDGVKLAENLNDITADIPSGNMWLFGYNGTSFRLFTGKIYNFKLVDNDNLICNLIPCYRKSDNMAGMYDLASSGKNLFDMSRASVELNKYIGADGKIGDSNNFTYTELMSIKPNTSYTISAKTLDTLGGTRRVHLYDASGNWISNPAFKNTNTNYTLNFTTTSNTAYCRFSYNTTDYNIQLEKGSTATTYEPFPFYTNSGTGTFNVGKNIYKLRDFQQVEYIESDGKQYIDTGFTPNQDSGMTIKFKYDINPDGHRARLAGVSPQGAGVDINAFGFWFTDNLKSLKCWGYGTNAPFKEGTIDTNKHTISQIKNLSYFDNELVHTFPYKSFTSTGNIYLFLINMDDTNNTVVNNNTPVKIYNCQIYDNGTLIRDLVPCYKKYDGTIGMFDKVNNEFYTNVGTGIFGKGADVEQDSVGDYDYTSEKYIIPVKVNNTTTNIYLDEPLRKSENYVDVLNYKTKKVTRNVSSDNLPLSTPVEETIDVPTIQTSKGTNIIEILTAIEPSGLSIQYWQQI